MYDSDVEWVEQLQDTLVRWHEMEEAYEKSAKQRNKECYDKISRKKKREGGQMTYLVTLED